MSYNAYQGTYNYSSDTTEFGQITIGNFRLTASGVYCGNKQVIDRYGNLVGLSAIISQISNITTSGLFTGIRQTSPQATLDIAGTGNFLGNITCASTVSAAALNSTGTVSAATGSFGTLSASVTSASMGSFASLAVSGTATALCLQATAASLSSLACSTASISSFVCSTISAGTYLGITPVFVGSGNSLVLTNTQGTHLTLINTLGGGTNSFAKIDFAGYPGSSNGAPMSLRFMDDGNYSGILSIRVKAPGSPSNGQNEIMVLNSGGQAFLGPCTNYTLPTLNLLPSPSGRNGIGMGTTTSGTLTVPLWVLNNNTGGGNPGTSLTNFYMYNYGTGQFPLIISADCTQFQVNCGTLTVPTGVLRVNNTGANQIAITNPSTTNTNDACEVKFDRTAGTSTAVSALGVGAGGRNAYWWVNGSDRINVTSTGAVGINTSVPGYTLDVNGNFHCNYAYIGGGSLSSLFNFSQSGQNGFCWGANSNSKIFDDGDLRIATDDNMHFYTGLTGSSIGTEYITISGGNVGINKPGPSYQLDVVGSVQWSQGSSFLRSNGGYVQWYRGDANTGDGLFDFYSDVGGAQTNIARITCAGSFYNKTGTYNTLSDQRKKKNITDARKYLDSLCKLRVRKYSWADSDDGDKPSQLGFVAQEVEEIMPGLVDTMKVDDLEDFKSIKTSVLIPMLVSAVQELQARLQAVERLVPQTSA